MRSCLSCERPTSCILAQLPDAELSAISQTTKSLNYQRGQVIWRAGIFCPGCFILCQGDAALIVRENGETKHRILKLLQAGDLIPCVGDLQTDDATRDFAIQVETQGSAWVRFLPEDSFGSLVRRHPSIAIQAIEHLSVAIRQLLHEIGDSSFCDTRGRVALALMELQESAQLGWQSLSQQVIADLSGVSRREVNEKLRSLAREKIVRIDHHRIQILDERRLRALVGL